jgi:alkylation response protein AidB-like acyl-CoA dehydrogenase
MGARLYRPSTPEGAQLKLSFSPEETAFQAEVRAFIAAHFPPHAPFVPGKPHERRWSAALLARGWAAYQWPVEHGGTGWSMAQRYIWERETALAGVPARLGGMGMFMLAPVLYTYGSAAQCQRFLPGILRNEVEWCQGYSEPEAGSDLAALRTRAVRDGDSYVVDGSKTWTSYAHVADWIFCLVRTETCERKQDGISFLLIDMRTPGIRVQPIVTIDGRHSSLNSVVFDAVRVPVENRIGDEGRGWRYAKGLLTHERTGLAFVADSIRRLRRLRAAAAQTPSGDGGMLIDEPLFAAKLAEVEIDLMGLEITELRTLAQTASGQAPGAQSSILKLQGTMVLQRLTELFVECAGREALPYDVDDATLRFRDEISTYLIGRSASIAGGSNEVQRNIIAKHVLGLA